MAAEGEPIAFRAERPARTTALGGHRRRSLRSRLLAAGVTDTSRAAACLTDPALVAVLPGAGGGADAAPPTGPQPATDGGVSGEPTAAVAALVEALGRTADPDLALLTLVRVAGAVEGASRTLLARILGSLDGLEASGSSGEEPGASTGDAAHAHRLLTVIGTSSALGDFLVAHPEHLDALSLQRAWDAPGGDSPAHYLRAAVTAALARDRDAAEGACVRAVQAGGARTEAVGREEERIEGATAALRVAYRDRLVAIAADDLTVPDPLAHVDTVGRRMAELVDASLDAALLIARAAVGPRSDPVSLAVIAMGKTGAQELNYISDVDVVYVVGPRTQALAAPGAGQAQPDEAGLVDVGTEPDEAGLVDVGTELATELARAVSAPGVEPPLWPLDAGLRPEGKDGALVRTLDSHVRYYERWASSWEFQALLKARTAAGDRRLGAAYEAGTQPLVWAASQRENFVDDARAMRRRVENESARPGTDRRIKLGPGGLRDVEFTVQLLQLVHARADGSLQVRPTLEALDALAAGGYVSRADAGVLDAGYRTLRLLEHRSQLLRLRRTHELPASDQQLRTIGRSIALQVPGGTPTHLSDPDDLWAMFEATRRQVRSVHESVYYRPLLGAAASLSADELEMTPQAARERLAAGGFLDPDGALRHIQALTEGVSRRAAIQRQILPVMIGWLGDGPDPDSGLLSFRRLSEAIGGSHWYLAMLRDSPVAARRLCQVLSGARWTTDRLAERPESIAWLDDDEELRPRPEGALVEEVTALLRRRAGSLVAAAVAAGSVARAEEAREVTETLHALTSVRSRELLRAALADSLDGMDPCRSARILTDATDAVLGGALAVATGVVLADREGPGLRLPDEEGRWPSALADHAVIAMGRLGGRELSYASDADVLFVHRPRPGVSPHEAAAEAEAVARLTLRLLAAARPHPLIVDADLRPEGKQGAMSRSLDSYREYYERWASTWERQALVRARACAGDRSVGEAFEALIEPLRWSPQGLSESQLREIRRLKARMEAERLPRGVEAGRHVKLGPGGLSDVEWSAQVMQLRHAGSVPALRTTSTLAALAAGVEAGVLEPGQEEVLREAWLTATRVRASNVVGTGRDSGVRVDVLPSEPRELRLAGRLVGLAPGHEREIEEVYRRAARHARPVAEALIYGSALPVPADPDGEAPVAGSGAPYLDRRGAGERHGSARSRAGERPGAGAPHGGAGGMGSAAPGPGPTTSLAPAGPGAGGSSAGARASQGPGPGAPGGALSGAQAGPGGPGAVGAVRGQAPRRARTRPSPRSGPFPWS